MFNIFAHHTVEHSLSMDGNYFIFIGILILVVGLAVWSKQR